MRIIGNMNGIAGNLSQFKQPMMDNSPRFNWMDVEVKAWIANYSTFLYMDVITYPCCNIDASLPGPYK